MVATLDFGLKSAPADLFQGARWSVLTMFILYANRRNRCWPSMRSLAAQLGKSLPHVTDAKQWLLEHEAIELVEYEHRVGDEKKIPNHQHLYQLTGVIRFGDQVIKYLHISDENGQSDDQLRESLKRNKKPGNDKRGESSNSMINSVDDQILSPLSIPSKDSNTSSEDKSSSDSAKPANAGSQASDSTMQQFNESAKPALNPVLENPFPTKTAEEEPPSKVALKVSPADWWKSEGMLAKLMLDARCAYTSRGIPETYINPGLERICNGSLRRWWEKFAYPGGSVDFMDAVEKDARQIVQGAEYIKAHELPPIAPQPPATPPKAVEASPMPQSSTRAVLEAVLAFPPSPKGFAWIYSSATDQPLAHLTTGSVKGVTLCKNKLNFRDFYNPGVTVVRRQPCAECLRIAAERAAPKADHAYNFTPEVKDALAVLCYGTRDAWNLDANAKLLMKALKALSNPTIDQLRTFYCNWYKLDFRGKRDNQKPEPMQVVSKWTVYTTEDCKQEQDIFGKAAVNNGSELQESTLSGEPRGDAGPEDRTNWRAEAAAKLPVIPASSRVR